MEIQGKIIAVLPVRSGTSASGKQWSSQTAVIETVEQYPKKLAFDIMGDKIQAFNVQQGESLTVHFDFDAHESNGRWFNSCRAWNVIRQQQYAPQQPAPQYAQPQYPQSQYAQSQYAPQQPVQPQPAPQQPQQVQAHPNDLPF